MQPYQHDHTHYYLDSEGNLLGAGVMDVPDEYFENSCKISEALSYVQGLGCQGRSQHIIHNDYHRCALAVLRMAVEKFGEVFPTVLRGCSGNLPISEHLILFGTTDEDVAKFYGEVKEFHNVKGLRYNSWMKSVKTDNLEVMDEEIIFFPEGL